MNYKTMSDHEINALATSAAFELEEWGYNDAEFYHCGIDGDGYQSQPILNYCNNPSDAWPIIIENKISIIDLGNEYMAVHGFQLNDDQYRDNVADWSLEARDKNPLRAAMIVFLMMGDNKNEN